MELGTNANEILELEEQVGSLTLERTVRIITELVQMHKGDPNFSYEMYDKMETFIADPSIVASPDKHADLIYAMKLEAILATENSPYPEVRANVDPVDDPDLPCSTVRAWSMGIVFSVFGTFIDTLFAFRYPGISIGVNVAQLVAYPIGCFFARVLPDWRVSVFGSEISLNPGPFNRKEHMLITIMANVSFGAPYTFYIIPVQAMPQYFNMPFAKRPGYQICISLAVNLFGYGMAGILRRFLVWPSIAIWPSSLSTIALIKAFHEGSNEPVQGPFKRLYRASREKIFLVGTAGMFCYWLFPGYIFGALSIFSWMTWIAPNNVTLDAICGIQGGLGLNPWPTFDWNIFGGSGLYLPTFAVVNQCIGIVVAALMIIGVWFSNAWNTGYLPINSNGPFDDTGNRYNATRVLDSDGALNEELYQDYSQPWFSAGYIVYNIFAFAQYTACFTYVWMFHSSTIKTGLKGIYRNVFKKGQEEELEEDVHFRLMQAYRDAPDWWYVVLLIVPFFFGIAAVAAYPTHASVGALFYGILIPVVFIIPIGVIQAVTGISVALNIIGDILGGLINAGHPNGLMYFKCWAYLSSWQALSFANDLKLAHYQKIPPRVTFMAQIVATFIFSVVSALEFNFIMGLRDVCTPDAAFRFTCPYQTSFFTATIFWGVIGPKKLFGPGQRYNMMLLGFPLGLVLVLIYWGLLKAFPKKKWIRNFHPVMLITGPVGYGAPYNLAFNLGNLYVNLLSFQYIRKHYLAFWAKWNYVISAAFSCGIALCGLFIFFALEIPKSGTLAFPTWWGNTVTGLGCEGDYGCPRLVLAEGGHFGAGQGQYQ
ncbi:OPT oligopeptide transporter protein-domain-containing protein [Kockovaella imperatae]|uniref:OPT oligopeptide transporter protein-domain-containing protein n=1 Tax=Kockovaella imperatae TaxID=4999 RepID=A0A1Y1UNC5_9TREE|nr:OPT oligopeptide transporter protein-domain-containing protein [Kockovaella imperatae]ORX39551.1 OPT oligopeptide transporter protein-domain-containing protein [Kockovaella imperatae]